MDEDHMAETWRRRARKTCVTFHSGLSPSDYFILFFLEVRVAKTLILKINK